MVDYLTHNVLRVFLASPGDLIAERRISREVVEEINGTLSRYLGWHIELLGWEDTLPGVGRPQERINVDVDACDLFVGIVWMRWGSPTGRVDSGFHEEFERARDRFTQTGKPEQWLFFKHVEPDRLRDPGPQLESVQAFRAQQVLQREVLFKEFINQEEWRALFRQNLSRYLLELAIPQLRASSSNTTPAEIRSAAVFSSSPNASLSTASSAEDADSNAKLGRLINRTAGQVVILSFPFSNLSTTKRRPALVLSNLCDHQDDRILCMITAKPSKRSITITDSDFLEGQLTHATSYVRPDRLFTADATLVSRVAGTLKPSKMNEILSEIMRIFAVEG